jgi:hypothetical protein
MLDTETIKRLHTIQEDMMLGNIQYAYIELGKILNEQYEIIERGTLSK